MINTDTIATWISKAVVQRPGWEVVELYLLVISYNVSDKDRTSLAFYKMSSY